MRWLIVNKETRLIIRETYSKRNAERILKEAAKSAISDGKTLNSEYEVLPILEYLRRLRFSRVQLLNE